MDFSLIAQVSLSLSNAACSSPAALLVFDCVPDIISFTLFVPAYFCVAINILGFVLGCTYTAGTQLGSSSSSFQALLDGTRRSIYSRVVFS